MSKSSGLLVICAVFLLTHMIALSFPTVDAQMGWIHEGADLDMDDMEFLMDSESSRRILATNRRYISYGALSRNNVPCSRRGASYYNCRRGGQANPYSRGCSAITRCRR